MGEADPSKVPQQAVTPLSAVTSTAEANEAARPGVACSLLAGDKHIAE